MTEETVLDQTDKNEEVYQLASPIKRFLNYLVDSTIISIIALFYLSLSGEVIVADSIEKMDPRLSTCLLFTIVAYYIILEGIFGKTMGKVLTKTHLVDVEGYRPSFLKIAIRTICRLIPLEAITFLIPGIMGWHDFISGTRVVEEVKI